MTVKHTPGPWHIAKYSPSGSYTDIYANGTPLIAKVILRHVSINEQKANARLIAAAPDLLEACEAIAALADGEGRCNLLEVAGQARKALAKAKTTEEV